LEELNRINKPELLQLAESLHIKAQNLSKSQIIKYIFGQRPSNTSEQQIVLESDTVEVFEDPSDVTEDIKFITDVTEETKFTTSMLTVPQSQVLSDSQSMSEAQLKYNLELKRLEFEQAKLQAEAEGLTAQGTTELTKMFKSRLHY